jgi:hypothetical protein
MKKQIFTSLIAIIITLFATTSAAWAAVIDNESIDLTGFSVFVPCADGGNGELVVFEGNLHVLTAVTFDRRGGVHVKTHNQPQGLTGVGQTTGDQYQATGVTQDEFNAKVGQTYTFVNNFRIIGQATGNNFLVHETYHLTINANGTVTAVHDNFTIDCK